MKVLVIGSNGLIGKTFTEIYKKKLNIYTCTRKDNIDHKLKKIRPNLIINLAVRGKLQSKMWETNILILKRLLDYTLENKNYLIQTGSSSEYGKRDFPTNELTPLMPGNMYETTKAAASMLVTGYSRTFKLKGIVVRPYCVYGVHTKKNRLIPIILKSLKSNKKLKIYKGCQDYIYVNDYVRALKIIIDKRKKWKFGEVVNIGTGVQYSNIQVVKTIEKVFKKKVKYKFIKKFKKYMDSNMWVCNPTYTKKKFGFKYQYSLKEGLEDMKLILEKNPKL